MIYIYLNDLFKMILNKWGGANKIFLNFVFNNSSSQWVLDTDRAKELRVKLLVSWVIHITGLCYWCVLWILTKLMRLQLQEMEMNTLACAYEDRMKSSVIHFRST